ncbi:hypothetical protein SETIT_9G345000v2 [Setaria italica]|uniref:NAC domain-containing protein n=1 Tax=Setaria italica TaxID=4555 RepID=K4AMS4_SETIT|nr:hypothetical protein SETIT_9G345000v2 [Setaria italica]
MAAIGWPAARVHERGARAKGGFTPRRKAPEGGGSRARVGRSGCQRGWQARPACTRRACGCTVGKKKKGEQGVRLALGPAWQGERKIGRAGASERLAGVAWLGRPAGPGGEGLGEEGWVVCRAFKKRTAHPPRSVAGAWDPSYSYYHHDPILAGAARFKQESPELDGAASAASSLLQYSSRLAVAELPQLESPPLPNQGSHRAPADGGEGDYSAAATTDWRALDRFVASQLTPDEEHATEQQEYCGKPLGTHAGDSGEDATDMVALLLLDGAVRHEEAGLLGSVADPAVCLHKNAARCGGHQEP